VLIAVDLGDTEAILKEYDGNLVNKVVSENLFGLLDASSLLWRLEVRAKILVADIDVCVWDKPHMLMLMVKGLAIVI